MKIFFAVLFTAAGIVLAADAQEWLEGGYGCRIPLKLEASAAAGNLRDFPVCVRLRDAELFRQIRPDGSDLRFTARDGKTLLAHEIERLDPAGNELICWVRLPEIRKGGATPFYLYFQNASAVPAKDPKAVWSNGYLAVWHMNGTAEMPDSLGNFPLRLCDGASAAPSLIGTGLESPGGKARAEYRYLRNERKIGLPAGSSFTISCWVKLRKTAGDIFYDYPVKLFYHSSKRWQVNFNKPRAVAAFSLLPDRNPERGWVNLCVVYDASGKTLQLFADGKPGTLAKNAEFSGLRDKSILALLACDASGDEFTISTLARSPEWIMTAYENQKSADSVSAGKMERAAQEKSR